MAKFGSYLSVALCGILRGPLRLIYVWAVNRREESEDIAEDAENKLNYDPNQSSRK